jgi:hypothetical protein
MEEKLQFRAHCCKILVVLGPILPNKIFPILHIFVRKTNKNVKQFTNICNF